MKNAPIVTSAPVDALSEFGPVVATTPADALSEFGPVVHPSTAPAPGTRGIAKHSGELRILTVKPNPKLKGSMSHARYEFYREGQTVAEFLAAGGDRRDLHNDTKKGFITLG